MAIVTLENMKAELGVTIADDDALITAKIDEAQAHLEALLGYKIETEFPDAAPGDLVAAVKQLAAGWYENRESTIVGVSAIETPHSVWEIVRNRRNYSYGAAYAEG
ncbi:phage gp6-like head-tail connector protein [Nitratireductor aquibiodomus]|uniref:head-tail connector protein n=1 Tax=Nitratireductor aquibiodomus TaxID=204799 RepID=UPI0019D33088|nr:head-tail connector protein [Nitratireductor aquibiodomus]MBN7759992.1 phage gp6-like head-tail connector protein [Nitratireductor aquibiodomus]